MQKQHLEGRFVRKCNRRLQRYWQEVISQYPESGEVSKGTTIRYVVSHGPEMTMVTVPNLSQERQEQAEQALKEAGLTPGDMVEDYRMSIPPGYV